ncbi:hypothetical protein ACIOUG_14625 [Pseudomonas sp. NPDC087803]|uniref:glycosyltransferase family 39 protein n=1 Tax=Pseudomonas sp. NPDC087803 TaxID=3364448 RepID=UPI00381D2BD9
MKALLAVPFFKDANVSVRADRLVLAAVLIIALCVRFYSITVPAIWNDEAYSLLLARETPARIWALTALDVHPPLYYVLLHYWVAVWGESPLAARAFSVLADIGTLLLCIKLMSLISTRRATWIAALLLALLPISVRYSQEVRMYTLLGFWLMAATVALLCWARQPEQKRFALIYVLLMTAAFYTHYFAGLCVLVHWLFWWQSRATRDGAAISAQSWLVANIAIVFLYLPWVPRFIQQLGSIGTFDWIKPVTLQGALTLVWQFTVLGEAASIPLTWQLLPCGLMLVFAGTIIISNPGKRHFSVLLVSYFFIPLLALYLVALALPFFVPRYLVFCAPALALISAAAMDIWGQRRIILASAALLLLVIMQVHGLTMVYRQTDGLNGTDARKDTGFSSLVIQLNRLAHPGDKIVIASAFWYPSFAYYNTTGIDPKFEIRTSIDEFLKLTRQGVFGLLNDPVMNAYIDGVTVLDCAGRTIWWITDTILPNEPPRFAKGRRPLQSLQEGNVSLYSFACDRSADLN